MTRRSRKSEPAHPAGLLIACPECLAPYAVHIPPDTKGGYEVQTTCTSCAARLLTWVQLPKTTAKVQAWRNDGHPQA